VERTGAHEPIGQTSNRPSWWIVTRVILVGLAGVVLMVLAALVMLVIVP